MGSSGGDEKKPIAQQSALPPQKPLGHQFPTPEPVEEKPKRRVPSWLVWARTQKGKNENDPEFNKWMSKKWSLFKMNLGTIAKSWAAWCGLAVAVSLSAVGIDYQKNGSLAKNWDKMPLAIEWKRDGIPEGAIVRINHKFDCNRADGNHVAFANGDCTAAELLKKNARIDLYGGNQGNSWKVSTYPAAEICAVRWPDEVKDHPLPGPILVSKDCATGSTDNESTR